MILINLSKSFQSLLVTRLRLLSNRVCLRSLVIFEVVRNTWILGVIVGIVLSDVLLVFLIELNPFTGRVRFDVVPVDYRPRSIRLRWNDHFLNDTA